MRWGEERTTATHPAAAHRVPHVQLELWLVVLHRLSRVLVQRITGIRLHEQELKPEHDRGDGQRRFPVLAQDVKAHFALQVNVRMVHLAAAPQPC